jgi:putative oxygen-independent coproporphyrinogen III oxidase
MNIENIPLSLYIHTPWCVKKCPYCDFNSHALKNDFDETAYIDALIADLHQHILVLRQRPLVSIFIGGGTPSLLSDKAYQRLFNVIAKYQDLATIEITLEANPGTVEQHYINGYREIGINRLSLGAQSFNDTHLKTLGRIHCADEIHTAIEKAKYAGFDNFNIDIMHALPQQTVQQAMEDLQAAIRHNPTHISWYQLTLEPNTLFYKQPPELPREYTIEQIETEGYALLSQQGYSRYEVSAYAKDKKMSVHNRNYWEFGDYIGIGAGAHSKITTPAHITRQWNVKHPKHYVKKPYAFTKESKISDKKNLPFEFMINAMRLFEPISFTLFEQHTGLNKNHIVSELSQLQQKKLIAINGNHFSLTSLGHQYLNDAVSVFLH